MTVPDALRAAERDTATILCFRALPVFAWCLLTRRLGGRAKVAVLAVSVGVACAVRVWSLLAWPSLALAYGYLVVAGCGVPFGARLVRNGRLTASAAFVACASVFLLVPGVLWPPLTKAVGMVLAWDLMLSSYSYCIEISRTNSDPPLGDCLFFLLVNPALVYARRGAWIGAPRASGAGFARLLLGLSALFAASALLVPAYVAARQRIVSGSEGIFELAACGALRFFIEYSRQSGLASLQIGLLRQVGYSAPERYAWPMFSSSIPDFWRRWNTYVSEWALRYVFRPLCAHLGRHRALGAVYAVGVFATFVTIGGLHDVYVYLKAFAIKARMTEAFALIGGLVCAWVALERLARRTIRRVLGPPSTPWMWVGASASRACLWICVVAFMIRWWT